MKEQLSECTNQTISIGDLEVPDPKSILTLQRLNLLLLLLRLLGSLSFSDGSFKNRNKLMISFSLVDVKDITSNMTRSSFPEADLDRIAQMILDWKEL